MTTEWLRLGDIRELPGDSEPDFIVGVVMSPYDVPEAMRGLRTAEGRFRIEFRYIDGEEQGKPVQLGSHVKATEGRYSGRLLAMEIDVDAIGANSVGVSIETTLHSAWDEVSKGYERSPERRAIAHNARRAAATREHELLGQLATR